MLFAKGCLNPDYIWAGENLLAMAADPYDGCDPSAILSEERQGTHEQA